MIPALRLDQHERAILGSVQTFEVGGAAEDYDIEAAV